MQLEASELPGKLRIFHVQLRLITGRLMSRPVSSSRFVALLRCVMVFDGVTPFHYVCHVMLIATLNVG